MPLDARPIAILNTMQKEALLAQVRRIANEFHGEPLDIRAVLDDALEALADHLDVERASILIAIALVQMKRVELH